MQRYAVGEPSFGIVISVAVLWHGTARFDLY